MSTNRQRTASPTERRGRAQSGRSIMNPQSTRAGFHAGDFVSEDAVRGALANRRRAPLRRWSVAELIARAVARPADGVSR